MGSKGGGKREEMAVLEFDHKDRRPEKKRFIGQSIQKS